MNQPQGGELFLIKIPGLEHLSHDYVPKVYQTGGLRWHFQLHEAQAILEQYIKNLAAKKKECKSPSEAETIQVIMDSAHIVPYLEN